MVRLLVVSSALLWLAAPAPAQNQPAAPAAPTTEYKIPPEAAHQANPVKPTPQSMERAKKLWGYDCAMCHGKNGDGKGDMAADIKPPLKDFTDPASLKDMTDGELFYIIQNGKGDNMPPEGSRAKPDEAWGLVNYTRSFAKKNPPAAGKAQ